MHYGMWSDERYGPGATLDPQLFVDACRRLGGPDTHVMELGGRVDVPFGRRTEAAPAAAPAFP